MHALIFQVRCTWFLRRLGSCWHNKLGIGRLHFVWPMRHLLHDLALKDTRRVLHPVLVWLVVGVLSNRPLIQRAELHVTHSIRNLCSFSIRCWTSYICLKNRRWTCSRMLLVSSTSVRLWHWSGFLIWRWHWFDQGWHVYPFWLPYAPKIFLMTLQNYILLGWVSC